jgi:hypothetical protein
LIGIAVPQKADEAFRAFKYVPYTALSHSARLKAARGEEDYGVNAQGGLTAKGLDRRDKNNIEMVDWQAAAHAAEACIRAYHGEERAKALTAHHRVVLDIARLHSWSVAVEYDIQQREIASYHLTHDVSAMDVQAFALITARKPSLLSSGVTTKRPRSPDGSEAHPRKKRQSQSCCFRCGLSGHMPGDCRANTTTAGKTAAAIAKGAKSRHGLLAPNGQQFCFNWARASSCAHGNQCSNYHGCSLCGEKGHGAGRCKHCA